MSDRDLSFIARYIQIDEEGYFSIDGLRVADAVTGREWLSSLTLDDRRRPLVLIQGEPTFVEAFDAPYVALDVAAPEDDAREWSLNLPYGHVERFALSSLTLDEWDRFHGMTTRSVPFVFSRSAQSRFFNLLEAFDDDSITSHGERLEIRPWLNDNSDVSQASWWSNLYRRDESRWDLHVPSHVLASIVPRLKLQRSRVLVAGAGSGNDAAWFAQQGHIVTAVDFSEEAIARAQSKFGHLKDLSFVHADVFALPEKMNGAFDLVFEHTLYCAILPSRRQELLKVWRKVLCDQGHLLGVFFALEKLSGPPFGGSEWELRRRLDRRFRSLYWTRLRDSRPDRIATELFVYAQKLAWAP